MQRSMVELNCMTKLAHQKEGRQSVVPMYNFQRLNVGDFMDQGLFCLAYYSSLFVWFNYSAIIFSSSRSSSFSLFALLAPPYKSETNKKQNKTNKCE